MFLTLEGRVPCVVCGYRLRYLLPDQPAQHPQAGQRARDRSRRPDLPRMPDREPQPAARPVRAPAQERGRGRRLPGPALARQGGSVTSLLYRQPTGAGRGAPGLPKGALDVAGRIEDFAEVLAQGYSRLHAAERLGVSYRTACRYITRLRQQGSGLALGDADDGLLGQPVLDQPGDLRWPDPALGGIPDRVSEVLTRTLAGSFGPAEAAGRGGEAVAEVVAHGHMVPHQGPD